MKFFYSCAFLLYSFLSINAQNVTIIESQSMSTFDIQDSLWKIAATQAGMSANIFPQTTLNDTLFFPTTDILIVSSGTKALPAFHLANIRKFLRQGGKIYLPGEYDPTFDTNLGFQSIVDSLGSNFTWGATVSGLLVPMNVFGSLAAPNPVNTLSYVWWGVPGGGCGQMEPFLEFQGNYYGFIFCDTISGGRIISASDMDWIVQSTSANSLMKNILYNLTNVFSCPSTGVFVGLGNDTLVSFPYTLDAGNPGSSYLWSTGDTTRTLTLNAAGIYWVQVTNATGCVATDTIQLLAVGENDLQLEKNSLTVFSDNDGTAFNIRWNECIGATLEIIDVYGRLLYSEEINLLKQKNVVILKSKLTAGLYSVRVVAKKKSLSKKFLIQ